MTEEAKKYAFEEKLAEELARENQEGAESTAAKAEDTAAASSALATAQAEAEQWKDQYLRLRAEFDNYRKRTLRENERIRKLAAEALIRDLLPVLDNLERALAHGDNAGPGSAVLAGLDMVLKQLHAALGTHGLEVIEAVGLPFDPQVHEAIAQQHSEEHPPDAVVIQHARGYRLGGELLRPAKVVVNARTAEAVPDESESSTGCNAGSDNSLAKGADT
jgi:molecular chaperone GrpE